MLYGFVLFYVGVHIYSIHVTPNEFVRFETYFQTNLFYALFFLGVFVFPIYLYKYIKIGCYSLFSLYVIYKTIDVFFWFGQKYVPMFMYTKFWLYGMVIMMLLLLYFFMRYLIDYLFEDEVYVMDTENWISFSVVTVIFLIGFLYFWIHAAVWMQKIAPHLGI